MQVLDSMWVYSKKYAPNVDPPCQPAVRYVIKGGPMDKDIYNAHEDTVRLSTVEVQLTITAVYRLLLEVIDLEQAFQATKVAPGSPPVHTKQFPGFERVPAGAPRNATWQQYVNRLNVTFQGTINGSSGLGAAVNVILTKEAGMTRLMWDRKGYWMYNGPAAKTLDEVIVLRDSGKLEGETSQGIPFGFAFLTVHADDFPLSTTGPRLTKFIKAVIGGHYKTTSTPGHRTLGRNLEIGNGYIRADCNDYWMRLANDHGCFLLTTPKHFGNPDLCSEHDIGLAPPVKGEPKYEAFAIMQTACSALIGAGSWGSTIDVRPRRFFQSAAAYTAHPTQRVYSLCQHAVLWLAKNPSYKQYGDVDVTSLLLSEHPTVPLGVGPPEAGLVALFDSATRDPRAVTGAAVMLGRVAVDIVSAREKIKTTGAHSGESGAAITLLHRLQPIRGLLQELMLPQLRPTPVYTDSASVLFISGGGSSIKHTPWLLGRMAVLLEAVDFGYIRLWKVAGTMNPTNSLTKHTPLREHSRDMAYFMNRLVDEYPGGPTRCYS